MLRSGDTRGWHARVGTLGCSLVVAWLACLVGTQLGWHGIFGWHALLLGRIGGDSGALSGMTGILWQGAALDLDVFLLPSPP